MDGDWISREGLAAYVAFFVLLLTPFIYPGFFPFDVNTILACSAALIFACLLMYHKPVMFAPRKLILAFAIVALIQLAGLLLGSMAAPGAWGSRVSRCGPRTARRWRACRCATGAHGSRR